MRWNGLSTVEIGFARVAPKRIEERNPEGGTTPY